MSINEEGFMHILRLLVLPLLISVCAAPVAAQSSSDKNPSPALSTQPQSAPASIRVDQLHLSFPRDRNDLLHTMPGAIAAGEHSSTIIPPLQLHAIRPLDFGALEPTLRQGDVCYSIRGYRVTRDDPESDLTRPAGYSTCQPADRFRVKDAVDLQEIAPR
jgi:hypothetical protein